MRASARRVCLSVRLIGKMREILSGILDYVQRCGAERERERGREEGGIPPDLTRPASLTSFSQHDVAAAEAVGSYGAARADGPCTGRTKASTKWHIARGRARGVYRWCSVPVPYELGVGGTRLMFAGLYTAARLLARCIRLRGSVFLSAGALFHAFIISIFHL